MAGLVKVGDYWINGDAIAWVEVHPNPKQPGHALSLTIHWVGNKDSLSIKNEAEVGALLTFLKAGKRI